MEKFSHGGHGGFWLIWSIAPRGDSPSLSKSPRLSKAAGQKSMQGCIARSLCSEAPFEPGHRVIPAQGGASRIDGLRQMLANL
jgi:hypothetical protein